MSNPICVIKNQQFRNKAKELDISEDALERIVHRYINEVGNADVFPTDSYIKAQYATRNIVAAADYDDLMQIWENTYSSPIIVNDVTEAMLLKETASRFFKDSAISLKPRFDSTIEIIVAKPEKPTAASSMVITDRKKSLNWEDYNPEQQEAITAAVEHINAVTSGRTSQKFFTIQGKAGTGKTTIVNEILKRMHKSRYVKPVVLMGALSHKATTVLKHKVNEDVAKSVTLKTKTIAGMLGMRKNNDGSFSVDKSKPAPIQSASIVFIDEASMVNEEQLEYILDAVKDRRVPVVFLGDVGQLPPVRASKYYKKSKIKEDAMSPVFTDESIPSASLVTRVRLGEDSPVLQYADDYWDFSQSKREKYPTDVRVKSRVTDRGALIVQRGEVDLVKQLLPLFQEAKRTGNPNLVKVVPYTTNSNEGKESAVDRYNRLIREQLYPNSDSYFEKGDLIIFNEAYGDENGIPNSLESAVIGTRPCPTEMPDAFDELSLTPVERIYVQFSTEFGTSEVPALVPTLKNRLAHKKNLSKMASFCAKNPRFWPKYWEYANWYAANIGYAYAIDSHKSQGSTYEVVAVDAVDINSVQPTSLKTKAQSTYTALTRASNVTIVSSNTTNEDDIYTDIKAINDRINAVKAGQATGTFTPAVEEMYGPTITEEQALATISGSKPKVSKQRGNIQAVEIDEAQASAKIPDYDESEASSWEDDDEEEEEEKPVKKSNKPSLSALEITLRDFAAKQKQLNSIIKFLPKTHTYIVNGKQADFSVTQFRDFIDDKETEPNDFLEIASRLGTTHDSILRDFFADDVKSSYPNMTKSQLKEFLKEALKFKDALLKRLGKDTVFITDEDLLKVAATVTYDGTDYTVAGTLDMVAIDSDGNIHIIDFKTKRANVDPEFSEEKLDAYGFQVSLYKAMLATNPLFRDKMQSTRLAQFNLRYASPKTSRYSFKNDLVYIEVDDEVVKLLEAEKDGKVPYKPGVFTSLIALKSDLDGIKVTQLKTNLQVKAEDAKVEKETSIEAKSFKGNMVEFYGEQKRDSIKAVSTFGAILEGKRTATTRWKHWEYWKNVKVGDIVTWRDSNGKTLLVRITVAPHKLSKDTDPEEWSKKEGWSVDKFNKDILPRIKDKTAFQMEYELINNKESSGPIEISSYNKKYALLSNFGEKPFTIDNVEYPTVEHYFQYKKARTAENYAMANTILKAVSAKQAKMFGSHRLKMTPEQIKKWDLRSEKVMRKGMREAFELNEEAKQLLLSTGDALLTHKLGGPFADILMELREEFGGSGKPVGTYKEEVKKEKAKRAEVPEASNAKKEYKGVTKIISGALTGVDTLGLEIGKELGLETGGTTTPGFIREKGLDSHTKESLKALGVVEISKELQGGKSGAEFYLPRTELNVLNSDGTVYFASDEDSSGKKATERYATKHGKPFLLNPTADELKEWLDTHKIETLNVAGNRGSKLSNRDEIEDILKQALSPSSNSGSWVRREDKQFKVSTEGYHEGDPLDHSDTAYVFTDNAQAYVTATKQDDSWIEEGYNKGSKVKLNVSDVKGTNQAGIRTDSRGNISKNAFGIVVKKYQQKLGETAFLQKEGLFKDTDEDFEMFKALNEDMFNRLEQSGLKKVVFPSQMAKGKAALPERFVDWLQQELYNRYGIQSTKSKNTKAGYEGFGLDINGIQEKKVDSSLHVEKINPRYSSKETSGVEAFNNAATELRKKGWHVEFYDKKSLDGTITNDVMTISIEGNPKKGFFELVKDKEDDFYSVHFKTKSKKALNNTDFASEALEDTEKEELFQALIYAIPEGGKVSTWGTLSKGGIKALDSLAARSNNILVRQDSREVTSKETGEPILIPIYKKLTAEEAALANLAKARKAEAVQKRLDLPEFLDDYFGILQSMEQDDMFTGIYTITRNEAKEDDDFVVDVTNGSKNVELQRLINSLPYSSVVTLDSTKLNANYLYVLDELLKSSNVYATYTGKTQTIDPNSAIGMIAEAYAKEGKIRYNKKTGELQIPVFTVGYSLAEIKKRHAANALFNNGLLSQEQLRNLSKATMYKLSEFITMLLTYANGYEILFKTDDASWEKDKNRTKDFTQMSRIQIINEVGLTNLLLKVRDRIFDSETADDSKSDSTIDKMDVIYNNWDAFVELGYDTLIGLEEIALDSKTGHSTTIKNDLNGEVESENESDESVIQELFGSSIEHWQVGFRQVGAFNSLSLLIKRTMDSLYQLDSDGNQKIDEFGIAEHLNAQEAVSKILYFTLGALSLDDRENGDLVLSSMLYKLKLHVSSEPWLQQVIELLEDQYEGNQLVHKADEQFKAQFYSNFKKYFQKYAITYEKKGKVMIKVINESQYADTVIATSQAKENSFALGAFKLKTKEGKLNQSVLKQLKDTVEKLHEIHDKVTTTSGKIGTLVDLDEYHAILKEVFDLLDIDTPADESLFNLFSVKKNLQHLNKHVGYLLDNIKEGTEITSLRDYKQIVLLISKEMGLEMESVSYEAGKMYYSYVLPSYLGRLVTKLSSENMSDIEYASFLQNEYLKYRWFNKDGKIRNHWLRRLKSSQTARENFQHTTSLHFLGTEYTNKTPVEYIASMMRMYFFDDNKKWAYFRVPIMSNKPSEEYLKFERIHQNYKNMITKHMWDVFTQELDRIQACRERQSLDKSRKIKNFDDANGLKFVFEDYLLKYLDGTFNLRPEYSDLEANERAEEARFSQLLNKKLDLGLEEDSKEYAELMRLFDVMTKRGFEENYKLARLQWIDEGFITLNQDGTIKKVFGDMKLTEDNLLEFFWNDAFAAILILELTVTDTAYYTDTEDLQKRLAQLHAPGMLANINASYVNKRGETLKYTKDGIERTMYIKDDEIKSSVLKNLQKASAQILADTPMDRRAYVKEQLNSIVDAFKKVNFADAQGYSCPSSYRKKMGIFGNWDAKMETAYEKVVHPELYPDVNISDLIDVLWQPLKPFVYTQITKPGYNSLLPEIKVGVLNKNSEYTLIMADALLRRAGMANKLSAIYDFMEESLHTSLGELNGEGIDTVQFESTVKAGLMGVIDLNDVRDKNGNITHYKTEEEIKNELAKAYVRDADGNITYNVDFVHEIPFEDYMIQQNVPAHFRGHEQAHGSQDRILTFADMLDNDPVTGEPNYLEIDGKLVTVAEAKALYFQAIADNIHESTLELVKRFHLLDEHGNNPDPRATNVAISRVLKDTILKDSRYGTDLLWACDTNEYGEFNIPLSDPIQSNRIQLLLNSIIKNTINKQEIAGGPVVQVSNWGTSDLLNIRFKNNLGELLLTEKEFNERDYPKDYDLYDAEKDVYKWQQTDGYVDYEDYIGGLAGVAYFEAYIPILDESIAADFTKKDADGNEYIDVEEMERTNPDLLNMIGYRIPTESKYSMVPIKVKGFLPRTAGEGIMLPAEITTMSGSDFDIDKMYIMRYTYNRTEVDGKPKYEKPTSGKGYRDNLIISTQLAVLRSELVLKQLFTPGNFEEPKKYGYLISYAQNEAKRTGRDVADIYNEAKNWDNDTLKAKNKVSKNLIFNNVLVQFHKQNMAAGKLIGIFALSNVSHAFISLHEGTYLNIPAANSFTLNGIAVENQYFIDSILTNDRSTNISNNLASLLAASVDAVKDPILNLININTDTANMVTALLRMGFSIETVSLLCSQPIIRDLIKEYGIKSAGEYGVDINSLIFEKLYSMPLEIRQIENIEVTNDDLINNLTGESEVTNYMVLQIFSRMLDIADTFGDITHMTRYNSITSAVGPFATDSMLQRIKDRAFYMNGMISDSIVEACDNPILEAFREDALRIERKLLGEHLIQAGDRFEIALDKLGKTLGYTRGVPSKLGNAFSDFYMSYYVNSSPRGSVFDLSYDNRKYMLTQFPKDFLRLKNKFKDNIFINSIQYIQDDREEFPFLRLKTRGMSSTALEDIKQAWISLYEEEGDSRNLAIRLAEYNFFRGSFGFSPKTFMNLTPNIVKSNLNNYITTLNNRDSILEAGDYVDRIIRLFILHNPRLIIDRYKDISSYNPTEIKDPAYGDCIQLDTEADDKPTIINSRPFILIDNEVYFVVDASDLKEIVLKKVDTLGGKGQGFEISITEDFPKSVYDPTFKATNRDKKDNDRNSYSKNIPSIEVLGVLIEQTFTEEEALEEFMEMPNKKALLRINKELSSLGVDYQVPTTGKKINDLMNTILEKIEGSPNPRQLLNKSHKSIKDLNLCS